MTTTAFRRGVRLAPHDGRLRLFCFPYAGASSGIFDAWQPRLPGGVSLAAVDLPGRGHRRREPVAVSIASMVDSVIHDVHAAAAGQPFCCFGHSMGALIAFELAREMRRRFGILPAVLYVSGHRAPHLSNPHPQTYDLPEPELIEELRRLKGTPPEVLGEPELLEILLPQIRADFQAVQTYRHVDGEPLACQIVAFGGADDTDVTGAELEAWSAHSTAGFRMRLFAGDHFFLHSQRDSLLDHLSADLKRWC